MLQSWLSLMSRCWLCMMLLIAHHSKCTLKLVRLATMALSQHNGRKLIDFDNLKNATIRIIHNMFDLINFPALQSLISSGLAASFNVHTIVCLCFNRRASMASTCRFVLLCRCFRPSLHNEYQHSQLV